MTTRTLEIAWTLDAPPLAPRSFHIWKSISAASSPAVAALEARLNWPEGTLTVLHAAFTAKLGRATGWQDHAQAKTPSPVEAAARVYKRGVGYQRADQASFASTPGSSTYVIDIVDDVAKVMKLVRQSGRLLIVDENVAKLWPTIFRDVDYVAMTSHEHKKTLDSVATLLEAAERAGSPKEWLLVGGGILTDVAAFAASLVNAAITMMPTTLLAMADASVGGKTGVNFAPFGKNQVGTFYFPKHVLASTAWLKTLPVRELLAGGAECMKHAFLAGDMTLAKKLSAALEARDLKAIAAVLPDVIRFKAGVVAEDPGENGRRAILNFGHTLAHALEGESQRVTKDDVTLLHGEAVALGMVFALLLSNKVAGLSTPDMEAMMTLMRDAGLILTHQRLAAALGAKDLLQPGLFERLADGISHDKKAVTRGQSQWILLRALGNVARPANDAWTIGIQATALPAVWHDFIHRL